MLLIPCHEEYSKDKAGKPLCILFYLLGCVVLYCIQFCVVPA